MVIVNATLVNPGPLARRWLNLVTQRCPIELRVSGSSKSIWVPTPPRKTVALWLGVLKNFLTDENTVRPVRVKETHAITPLVNIAPNFEDVVANAGAECRD